MARPQAREPRREGNGHGVRLLSICSVALLLILTPTAGVAQLLDRPLQNLTGALSLQGLGGPLKLAPVRVIIRTEGGLLDRVLQRVVSLLGGRVVAAHPFINAVTVTLPAPQVQLLVRLPGVLSVSLDAPVAGSPLPDVSLSALGRQGHLAQTLGLDQHASLLRTVDGSGIGVGVIDSGLAQTGTYRITGFVDFTTPSRGRSFTENARPYDDYGHGTHVAGLIAGNGSGSSEGDRGVAPGASLVGLKVLDGTGAGYTSDVLLALEYAVTHKRALGLRILNLSLGHPIFEPADRDPLVQGVEAAVRSGLIVVVSAGNFGCLPKTDRCGYAGITSPGNAPSAITVGAIDTQHTASRLDDDVASYSSRGPSWYDGYAKPDLVAPGHALVSAMNPASTLGRDRSRRVQAVTPGLSYARLSGTSMAAAVASGAAALVLDANERGRDARRGVLTPNAVKAVLEYTSFDVTTADALTEGAGALNAAGAIDLARRLDPAAPMGRSWQSSGVTPSTTINGDVLPWTRRIIWGDRIVWGNALETNAPSWAQSIVWGDLLIWGDSIIWGELLIWSDSIVWGELLIWSDSIVWGESMYDASAQSWANLASTSR